MQHPYFGYLPANASLELKPAAGEKRLLADDDDKLDDLIDDLEQGE